MTNAADVINDELTIETVPCTPYADQSMGTAGLRKKVAIVMQRDYLESFLQALLDTLSLPAGATLVIGGDGRYYNDVAIQVILRMCAAAGVRRFVIGNRGLLSTPAASHLIRTRHADGGFLLTASHNPGGPSGDFGIKFNMATGGQAPPDVTSAIYAASRKISAYRIATLPPVSLDRNGVQRVGPLTIEVVDPVADYQALMERLFDFELIRVWLRGGHRIIFDAMHGITGPYARRILCEALGADEDSLRHATPLPDFGGLHPDPNPVDAQHLVALSNEENAADLLAASDGDGDRNMILGPSFLLSPGDSIAMMLANATRIPGYRDGVPGVARSMPTSRAVDAVAREIGIPCFETPTGWRYFCNLLESGRIGLCGEESFGTGSWHAREKDGLWAVLFWLNLLAACAEPLPALAVAHWRRFGRHYFQRHDYHIAETAAAEEIMSGLRTRLADLAGGAIGGARVATADDFAYVDPVDGSEVHSQGIRITLDDGSRMVYRLSGTGTSGATLRIYLERHERDPAKLTLPPAAVLSRLGEQAARLADIRRLTGLAGPTMTI